MKRVRQAGYLKRERPGRPPAFGERMRQVTVGLRLDQTAWLVLEAAQQGLLRKQTVAIADIVRWAVDEYIERAEDKRKGGDAAKAEPTARLPRK